MKTVIYCNAMVAFVRTNGSDYNARFRYVEFASRSMPGFRNLIIDAASVRRYAENYRNFEAFTSMYLYPDDVFAYIQKNIRDGKPSISGYDGPIFSNYLFIDIDSKNLADAKKVAKRLVSFLYEKWALDEGAVTIAFSGSKGYHIGIDARAFGEIRPSVDLNVVFARMRAKLPELAGISRDEAQMIDNSISDKTRLWRLVNTRNAKSGLYKIQITAGELYELSSEEIAYLARRARGVIYTDETGLFSKCKVQANAKAEKFYESVLHELSKNGGRNSIIADVRPKSGFWGRNYLCKAEKRLLSSRVPEGRRNVSALYILSALRRAGFSKDEAAGIVLRWNRTKNIGLSEREIMSVVKSVYRADPPYIFGCNSLKAFCPYADRRKCADYREFVEGKRRKCRKDNKL